MRTQSRIHRISAIVGGILGMAMLVGVAPTPVTVKDRFTDNSLNTQLWTTHQFGGLSLNETSQRLQFAASGVTGSISYAGLEVKSWGANWKYDFEIEADYKLNLGNVSGNKEVIVGIGLALTGTVPETFTGYAGAIFRDDVGLKLAIGRYSNGNQVEGQVTALAASSGQLKIEWDRSNDILTASVGAQEVHLNGVWSRFGASKGSSPMVIALGCSTIDGNISFPGTRVWADDFQFVGVKRPR